MATERKKILIYYVHPTHHKSRLNASMVAAVSNLEDVTIRRLYDLYPDFYIDVKKEQEMLIQHDIIVWQHPFYWFSAPPLLKEWIDLVLEHGFAFGKEGNALKGKKMLTAATTGATLEAYSDGGPNRYTFNQFLAPYEATVTLCKMTYLPPFVIHGSLLIDKNSIQAATDDYKKIIISLRDDIFDESEILDKQYINHLLR
jgi:glutathione-regulated potassium-efflux system ancillary protein KefG